MTRRAMDKKRQTVSWRDFSPDFMCKFTYEELIAIVRGTFISIPKESRNGF